MYMTLYITMLIIIIVMFMVLYYCSWLNTLILIMTESLAITGMLLYSCVEVSLKIEHSVLP